MDDGVHDWGDVVALRGCYLNIIILKNDPNYIQGIPDLILLYKNRWAALEVKRGAIASVRPNQAHYVRTMHAMSYAAFIYPENESEILSEVQQSLTA